MSHVILQLLLKIIKKQKFGAQSQSSKDRTSLTGRIKETVATSLVDSLVLGTPRFGNTLNNKQKIYCVGLYTYPG